MEECVWKECEHYATIWVLDDDDDDGDDDDDDDNNNDNDDDDDAPSWYAPSWYGRGDLSTALPKTWLL